MGGESNIIDIIALEQVTGNLELAVGLINFSTLRFVDQHESLLTQCSAEDFACEQCNLYF